MEIIKTYIVMPEIIDFNLDLNLCTRYHLLFYIFKFEGMWGQDCLPAVAKKAEVTKRSHCHCFPDFEDTLD